MIVEGTREGLEAARARGQHLGRPPALSAEQIRHARALLREPENSVSSTARLLEVSRSTQVGLPERYLVRRVRGRRAG